MTEVRPLSKAPNAQLLPRHCSISYPLLQVHVHLDGLNAENTLFILCIIVYVTNKKIMYLYYYVDFAHTEKKQKNCILSLNWRKLCLMVNWHLTLTFCAF